MNQKSDSGKKW